MPESEGKSFKEKSNEYADKYEAALKEGTEALLLVGMEAIERGTKKVEDVKRDIKEYVSNFRDEAKRKAYDISETVALYALVGLDKLIEAKDKGADLVETAAIYGLIGVDKVKEVLNKGKDIFETAAIVGLIGIDKAQELVNAGIIKSKEVINTIKDIAKDTKGVVVEKAGDVKRWVGEKAENVKTAARNTKKHVEEKRDNVKRWVGEKTENVKATASQVKGKAIDTGARVVGGVRAVGRVGKELAVGAAVYTITGVANTTKRGIEQGKNYFGPKIETLRGLPTVVQSKLHNVKEFMSGQVGNAKKYVDGKVKDVKSWAGDKVKDARAVASEVKGKAVDTGAKVAGGVRAVGRVGKELAVGAAVYTITGVANTTKRGIEQGKNYFGPKIETLRGLPTVVQSKLHNVKEFMSGQVGNAKKYVDGKVQDAKNYRDDAILVIKNRGKRGLVKLFSTIARNANEIIDKIGPVLTKEEELELFALQKGERDNSEVNKGANSQARENNDQGER